MGVRRSLEVAHVSNRIRVVTSGEEALAYLKGEGLYGDRKEYPIPGLILIDLRLPKMTGFQVLGEVGKIRGLEHMRKVVLSGSRQAEDVAEAKRLGASSFLVKPLDFEKFAEFSAALAGSWLWSTRADRQAGSASDPSPVN